MANRNLNPTSVRQFRRYLNFVSFKFKYYSWPRIVLGGLNVLGIHIQPFYVMQEGIAAGVYPPVSHEFKDLRTRYLEAEDMLAIAALPDYAASNDMLLTRLKKQNYCLGLFDGDKLAAFSWCDLEECNFRGYHFTLSPDEGYLYDAHTLREFRGKGLAPFVRYRIYRELEKIGRVTLYSITERFNKPALRFKKKLHAKRIDRGMHIGLFSRWHFNTSTMPPGHRGIFP